MADISNVQASDIKDISDSLEALSCKPFLDPEEPYNNTTSPYSHTRTILSYLHEGGKGSIGVALHSTGVNGAY